MDLSQYIKSEIISQLQGTTEYSSEYSVTKTRTTNDELYFVIIRAGKHDTHKFQFVPSTINYRRKASYANVDVIMRNIPKPHYTGGDASMSFQLDYFAEQEDRSDVVNRVRELEAATYADGFNSPPAIVKVVWGKMFREELWVITDFNAKYSDFRPMNGFLPQQAYVDLTLQLISETNPTVADINKPIVGSVSPAGASYPKTNGALDKRNQQDYIFNTVLPKLSNPSYFK
jgi:hypothetical protein